MTGKTMAKDKGTGSAAITKDMPIGKIVGEHPETAEVFMKHGMHCLGCAASHFENLEQGCAAHGIDVEKLVKDLNTAVKNSAVPDEDTDDEDTDDEDTDDEDTDDES